MDECSKTFISLFECRILLGGKLGVLAVWLVNKFPSPGVELIFISFMALHYWLIELIRKR